MLIASLAPHVVTAAQKTGGAGDINPWFVGAGVLLLLLAVLAGLLAFAGGREHT
jgi:hypothetical protein